MIFGPAYKGIPLVTAVAMAWFQLYNQDVDVSYNRKEAKDHGEVSAPFFSFCLVYINYFECNCPKCNYLIYNWLECFIH